MTKKEYGVVKVLKEEFRSVTKKARTWVKDGRDILTFDDKATAKLHAMTLSDKRATFHAELMFPWLHEDTK